MPMQMADVTLQVRRVSMRVRLRAQEECEKFCSWVESSAERVSRVRPGVMRAGREGRAGMRLLLLLLGMVVQPSLSGSTVWALGEGLIVVVGVDV